MSQGLATRDPWFLDFDGTLADSSTAHARAFRETLAEWSPVVARNFVYADHCGRATDEVFAGLGLVDPETSAKLVRRKQERYRREVSQGGIAEFPGGTALLRWLSRHGHSTYLVSGGSRGSVEAAVRALCFDRFLTGVVTAEEAARGKPDADIFRVALRRSCGDAARAVAVEDSPAGVQAAQAAGLQTVQVHTGRPEPGVLAFRTLGDLLVALRRDDRNGST